MCQQGDTTFVDIHNALREGKMTSQHLNVLLPESQVLKSKELRICPINK